jgi:alkylhydroperoxidase/carboxymuconolactone decarboxylase family protein YurZ
MAEDRRPGNSSDYDLNATFLAGDRTRRKILGDDHVDASYAEATGIRRQWRQFATEIYWASVWPREGLDTRSRRVCTIAALAAIGDVHDLRTHIRASLANDLTSDELAEIFIQVGAYTGLTRATSAFRIAQEVLDEPNDDKDPPHAA